MHTAENTLSALRSTRSLFFAGIYRAIGTPFVVYWRDHSAQIPPVPATPVGQTVYSFHGGELSLARSIVLGGKPIGTIYLLSDSLDINDRLIRYAEIVTDRPVDVSARGVNGIFHLAAKDFEADRGTRRSCG